MRATWLKNAAFYDLRLTGSLTLQAVIRAKHCALHAPRIQAAFVQLDLAIAALAHPLVQAKSAALVHLISRPLSHLYF